MNKTIHFTRRGKPAVARIKVCSACGERLHHGWGFYARTGPVLDVWYCRVCDASRDWSPGRPA